MENSNVTVGNMPIADLINKWSVILDEKMKKLPSKDDFEEIKTHMNDLLKQVEDLKVENQTLKDEIKKIKADKLNESKRLELVEEQQRRKNIIFNGVKLQKRKSLNDVITNICSTKLKLGNSPVVNSTRKLREHNGTCTVLAEMVSANIADEALRRRKLLRGSSIYMDRDLNMKKQQQKNVMITLKKDILSKDKTHRVSVVNEKLKIGNQYFSWNDRNILVCGNQNGHSVINNIYKNIKLEVDYNKLLSKLSNK